MNKITSIIKQKYYTYTPGEFMPVYNDGELSNKSEFHAYKVRSFGRTLGEFATEVREELGALRS